ncbi:HTH domain-containing protein [Haloarcula salina]|uniref:HTH domain-containing protein n=1 Tax=Haloarcula salina TaxID=1429914 RepID=UPI003C6F5628
MTAERRVVVFLRSPVASETQKRQETVLARIEALKESGSISDFAVRHWKRLAELEADDSVLPSLAEMDAWAAARDVTLEPAFDRHERSSGYTGRRDEVVTLPVVCVTVLDGDDLLGVYPHVCPKGCRTVADCLDELESEPTALGSA